MSDFVLVVAVYLGIGLVWLSMVVSVSRRQFEYVSPKESAVHILGWPYVFFELKLWWLAADRKLRRVSAHVAFRRTGTRCSVGPAAVRQRRSRGCEGRLTRRQTRDPG